MGLVKSSDGITAFVDTGSGVLAVWMSSKEIDEVTAALKDGSYLHGDSDQGEVYFAGSAVKFLQSGRRELSKPVSSAGNRM